MIDVQGLQVIVSIQDIRWDKYFDQMIDVQGLQVLLADKILDEISTSIKWLMYKAYRYC